jgi:hypothetical protein
MQLGCLVNWDRGVVWTAKALENGRANAIARTSRALLLSFEWKKSSHFGLYLPGNAVCTCEPIEGTWKMQKHLDDAGREFLVVGVLTARETYPGSIDPSMS